MNKKKTTSAQQILAIFSPKGIMATRLWVMASWLLHLVEKNKWAIEPDTKAWLEDLSQKRDFKLDTVTWREILKYPHPGEWLEACITGVHLRDKGWPFAGSQLDSTMLSEGAKVAGIREVLAHPILDSIVLRWQLQQTLEPLLAMTADFDQDFYSHLYKGKLYYKDGEGDYNLLAQGSDLLTICYSTPYHYGYERKDMLPFLHRIGYTMDEGNFYGSIGILVRGLIETCDASENILLRRSWTSPYTELSEDLKLLTSNLVYLERLIISHDLTRPTGLDGGVDKQLMRQLSPLMIQMVTLIGKL